MGSGMNVLGEIVENVSSVPLSIPLHGAIQQGNTTQNAQTPAPANAVTRGRGRGRGRAGRPFFRQTGESNPYDMYCTTEYL